jgi:TPR repeat protein
MPTAPPADPRSPDTLAPEAILREIFAQAFARQPLKLPPGATASGLRAALALEPDRIKAIFDAARHQARPSPPASQPINARAKRFAGFGAARTGSAAAGILASGIAIAISLHLASRPPAPSALPPPPAPPPVTTAALYQQAGTVSSALTMLQARATAGDAAAQFDLATLLDSNLQISEKLLLKNNAASARLYERAAAAGLAQAQNNLAFDYETGHGMPHDDARAAKWYLAAAAQGLANAQNSLGFLYQTGRGVPQNAAAAAAWYGKAAAQNLALAQNNYGAAFESGNGVPQNFFTAATWFQRAAAQGEPNAENSLGYLYFKGFGVPRDFAKSFKLFAAAAAQNLPAAEMNLGFSYATGAGTKQDQIIATKWFLRAQAAGDATATTVLSAMNPPLTPAQLNTAKTMAAVK